MKLKLLEALIELSLCAGNTLYNIEDQGAHLNEDGEVHEDVRELKAALLKAKALMEEIK